MTELAAWLLEQIAEDEKAAKAAIGSGSGTWTPATDVGDYANTYVVADATSSLMKVDDAAGDLRTDPTTEQVARCGSDLDDSEQQATHIARWDPARVLADCQARRAIVTIHGREHRCPNHLEWDEEPCTTLRLLAQPFADHPEFDSSWLLDEPDPRNPG